MWTLWPCQIVRAGKPGRSVCICLGQWLSNKEKPVLLLSESLGLVLRCEVMVGVRRTQR